MAASTARRSASKHATRRARRCDGSWGADGTTAGSAALLALALQLRHSLGARGGPALGLRLRLGGAALGRGLGARGGGGLHPRGALGVARLVELDLDPAGRVEIGDEAVAVVLHVGGE